MGGLVEVANVQKKGRLSPFLRLLNRAKILTAAAGTLSLHSFSGQLEPKLILPRPLRANIG
jgi:hypothetical protein